MAHIVLNMMMKMILKTVVMSSDYDDENDIEYDRVMSVSYNDRNGDGSYNRVSWLWW